MDADGETALARTTHGSLSGNFSERIGARLGAARTARGLDLVDIARETRIPVRHLRAIEADNHDDLPAMPYAIGFVKSLARQVGIDPEEASARFKAETSKTPHIPASVALEPLDERRLPPRGLVVASVAATLLILGGLGAYGAGWFDSPTVAPAVAVVAAPGLSDPQPMTAGAAQSVAPAGVAPAAVPGGGAPAVTPPGPGVPSSTVVAGVGPAVPGSGVTIVAADDAWIRITHIDPATGKVGSLKTGLLTKGERYNLPAGETSARLWTGRAGALQLSVAGRALPPLGGPVETIKNVSLDPTALLGRVASPTTGATPR